jgi:hypothetical protein
MPLYGTKLTLLGTFLIVSGLAILLSGHRGLLQLQLTLVVTGHAAVVLA